HFEQGRFAAARRPHHGEKLAAAEVEIDRPQRLQLAPVGAGEDLGDVAQGDVGGHALVYFTMALMSSGRKRVSMILSQSTSPWMAPTMRCTSIMRFIPSRWICPVPQ